MSWKDSAKGMAGASKAPKKHVREVRTRRGASGGYIHEHHHMSPEHHPMEEHTSPDQDAMVQHMMAAMPNGPAASAPPAPDAGAPTGAPAAPAPAPMSGPTPGM